MTGTLSIYVTYPDSLLKYDKHDTTATGAKVKTGVNPDSHSNFEPEPESSGTSNLTFGYQVYPASQPPSTLDRSFGQAQAKLKPSSSSSHMYSHRSESVTGRVTTSHRRPQGPT